MVTQPKILVMTQQENSGLVTRLNAEFSDVQIHDNFEIKNILTKSNFDVFIIDTSQSCKDIWNLALNIKEYSNSPIVLLTEDVEECERLLGYELVNDFVKKPYDISEVICRINILLNRTSNTGKFKEIAVEGIKINFLQRTIRVNNKPLELTQKEFDLLYYLIINKERVITRDEIVKEIWKNDYKGNSRTVDTHIKRLRNKIKSYSSKDYIDTVWGVGYRIVV